MSDRTRSTLEIVSIILGLLVASAAFAKAWFVLPYRVEQLESRASTAEDVANRSRELLLRIDERTANMQRDITELKARRTLSQP